jgi:hypothetical protein
MSRFTITLVYLAILLLAGGRAGVLAQAPAGGAPRPAPTPDAPRIDARLVGLWELRPVDAQGKESPAAPASRRA